MKRTSLLMLVVLAFAIFNLQTAAAQFPKIKVPKVNQPATPPTSDGPAQTSGQPATGNNSQPTQPAGGDRGTASAATVPAINKPSIQITLRTHQQYYRNGQRDEEMWSWTPRISYRVNGPIPAGGCNETVGGGKQHTVQLCGVPFQSAPNGRVPQVIE